MKASKVQQQKDKILGFRDQRESSTDCFASKGQNLKYNPTQIQLYHRVLTDGNAQTIKLLSKTDSFAFRETYQHTALSDQRDKQTSNFCKRHSESRFSILGKRILPDK